MVGDRNRSDRPALPVAANAALAVLHLSVSLYQFFILPLCLLPLNPVWAWTVVPLAFLNNPYWSLIHEAIHDLFHPAQSINAAFGRIAGVLFGAPFRILRLSHLLHHKLNRTPLEATEVFDPISTSKLRAASGYYFQILGGLYLVEFMSALLFLLPRTWIRAFNDRFVKPNSVGGILMQNWISDESIREIRTDGLLVLGWFGLSLWCYGEYWWLLLSILAARAFFISVLDNVYHYRTPINDIFYATNLWLPGPCAKLLLNFNLHGIHHRHPAVPWRRLPLVFCERASVYQGNYLAAAARQLNGPVALHELGVQGSNVQKFKVGDLSLNVEP
jgi:fatty acid desaturase